MVFAPQLNGRPQFTPQLDYAARLSSHALQANGSKNLGNIWAQIIYNGQKNGQAAIFLNTPQRTQWFVGLLRKDIQDDGVLNGSSLLEATRESYYAATGTDIPQLLTQTKLKPADFSRATVLKNIPDPSAPGGFQQIANNEGVSATDLGWQALWGHVASTNGEIANPATGQFINDTLTNQGAPEGTYQIVHADPNLLSATQNLAKSNNPAASLNNVFLSSLENAFKLHSGALGRDPG